MGNQQHEKNMKPELITFYTYKSRQIIWYKIYMYFEINLIQKINVIYSPFNSDFMKHF